MIAFSLALKVHIQEISGKGAELYGGRWNSRGTPMLYCTETLSVAVAEIALRIPLHIIPENSRVMKLELPDSKIYELNKDKLPKGWNAFPHPASTQAIGDNFILHGDYLLMKVPSVTGEGGFNILINPNHPDHKKIKIIEIGGLPF